MQHMFRIGHTKILAFNLFCTMASLQKNNISPEIIYHVKSPEECDNTGITIICSWSVAESDQKSIPGDAQKKSTSVIYLTSPLEEQSDNTNDQNHGETTPTGNLVVDGDTEESTVSSPELSSLKRPISTPFRHQMHHVRLRGLRRSFKKRRDWIQGKTEETSNLFVKSTNTSHAPQESDDDDSECEVMDGRKRRHIASTVRRKRVRLLRGLVRVYCGDTDSDDSDSD